LQRFGYDGHDPKGHAGISPQEALGVPIERRRSLRLAD
jgi:hypothetical protein